MSKCQWRCDHCDYLINDPEKCCEPLSDAAIKACAIMVTGICKTRPQETWANAIEGRIRYMLTKLGEPS